jgi:hypothetical protein
MNATMAIMARELVARRDLLVVAFAAAVIASAMPLMPGLQGYTAEDVRTVSSNGLAVGLGWGLSILLGATVLGRDLSENRLGFFFARPVSGLAVWWGRVLAVLFLIWMVEAIVLLPSLYGGGIFVFASWEGGGWPALLGYLAMPVLLMLLAHAVSVMVRARTAWVFLDLVGCVAACVAGWLTVRPFVWMYAQTALWVVGGGLLVALVMALVVAGATGLVVGRTELRRTHGALSVALWGTLALGLTAVAAYSGWLRDIEPEDFARVDVMSIAPTGGWVEIMGRAPGHFDVTRRCLVATTDDRWLSLPGGWGGFSREVVFSIDGSTAVWLGVETGEGPRALWWADLESGSPGVKSTTLVFPADAVIDLSPDGRRVAVLEEQILSVYELVEERLLTAVRLPEDLRKATPFFHLPGSVRLYAWSSDAGESAIQIAEVDTITGDVDRMGEIVAVSKRIWTSFDARLRYMALTTRVGDFETPTRVLYDARSGEVLRALTGFAGFLEDGRILSRRKIGDDLWLVVDSPGGDELVTHNLGAGADIWNGGEALPGHLLILRSVENAESEQGRRADLLDLEDGSWREVGQRIRRIHAAFQWRWGSYRAAFWYVNQPPANRLFTDTTGALVRWDPETGELTHIVGGRD